MTIIPEHKSLTSTQKFYIWLACFAAFFVMYIIYYPGGFPPDPVSQYGQAAGFKNYNDWHPVLHTLIFFSLPLKISGGWLGSIVLFQIIIFSLALFYTASTFVEFGNKNFAKIMLLYMLLNPATLGMAATVLKDTAFAIFAMIAMAYAVKIHFTGGKWLESPAKILLFLIVISACTIFRHNAILFTFPLLIAVMLHVNKMRKILLLLGFCAIILFVRWPLYSYLNVENPPYRVLEATKTPVRVITNTFYENPEYLDDEIKNFVNSIVIKEVHEEKGELRNFEMTPNYREIVEQTGLLRINYLTLKCFLESPMAAFRALTGACQNVFCITGRAFTCIIPYIEDNEYGIKDGGIKILQELFFLYARIARIFVKYIFHIGVLLLLIIIFILAKLKFDNFKDWQKFFLALPIFTYNFGTMMLCSDSDRFFYVTFLVTPLILLLLLRDDSEKYHDAL